MRAARLVFWLALLGVTGPALLAPAPVYAEDNDDEFETGWIGARLGVWYRPTIDMNVQISGEQPANPLFGLLGSDFDIHRNLGVAENVYSDYVTDFDREAIPELEIFLETEWVSLYVWFVPPYEYRGGKTLTQTLVFGGETFSASTRVESSFEQFYAGVDLTINIFNNRFFKIAPLIGIRALGIDWEIKAPDLGRKADTSDINSPISWEEFEVFPYPELGADIRVGYRDYVEVGIRGSGMILGFSNLQGRTLRIEAFVAVYPIPWIGIQIGVRHAVYDIKAKDADNPKTGFDFDLEFQGFTGGVTVRF